MEQISTLDAIIAKNRLGKLVEDRVDQEALATLTEWFSQNIKKRSIEEDEE